MKALRRHAGRRASPFPTPKFPTATRWPSRSARAARRSRTSQPDSSPSHPARRSRSGPPRIRCSRAAWSPASRSSSPKPTSGTSTRRWHAAARLPRRGGTLTARCAVAQDRYECAGAFTLRGSATAGSTSLSVGDEPLPHYTLADGVPREPGPARAHGQRRRASNASSSAATGADGRGHGHDRRRLRARARSARERAVTPTHRSAAPRCARALGLASPAACCEDAAGLAPPQEDAAPRRCRCRPKRPHSRPHCAALPRHARAVPAEFPLRRCAAASRRVCAQCAPRIFVRLSMWQAPPIGARQGADAAAPRVARRQPVDRRPEPDPAIASLQQHGRRLAARRDRHSTPNARRDARCPATRTCAPACRPARDPTGEQHEPRTVTESGETGCSPPLFRHRRSVRVRLRSCSPS